MKIEIEKNVPLPPKKGGSKYPFAQMDIGDSCYIPDVKQRNMGGFLCAAKKDGKNSPRARKVLE